jgi:type 1 glutamine amidotransferase/glucose/arabinose dehydrogenase
MAARPSLSWHRLALALLCAALLACAAGASPALANAGKVLVFTGTTGTANPVSADAASAIQALGAANDFTVDVTADAAQVNAANLAGYRAVVFVNSVGDVLNAAQETDLQNYVQTGGGFVGIGDTALLEQGGAAFFNTLTGLAATRVSGTATVTPQDVEFLDRVHPATRNNPMLWKGVSEKWYTWGTNPTGTVHTVARVRFNSIPDGSSVTNDAVRAATTNQPQGARAAAWCRDVQMGRSFYSEIGGSTTQWADQNVRRLTLGGIQWAAGMVRGNCKATINSNYSATRLTPPNPSNTSNQYTGELTNSAIADNGLVFYTGRAVCNGTFSTPSTQPSNWDLATTGLGCGTLHVWDPRAGGNYNQDPSKVTKVAEMSVFGMKGSTPEAGQTSTSEEGLLAIALDQDFTKGRPYIYLEYFPYYGGEQGKDTLPKLGWGLDRRRYRGERRLSRFTYDEAAKTLVPGSEKVIMQWDQSVFSCCHEGASAAWDSQGNLYVTNGDNTGNAPNATNGGYTNADDSLTAPCPGAAATTHCAQTPADQRPADTILDAYGDAARTSGNTNTYDGKMIRIHPLANPGNTPGVGSTYTIPGADAPNGPNLFPPDSQPVKDGLAKPEIFAMGVRNDYTIHIDKKTDAITTAWVGPDQGNDSTTWGPAKTENATMMNAAGNYGWPFCQAGNRWGYRAKLPGPSSSGGVAAPLGFPGTVGGGADGQTGGFFDCRGEVMNSSPYNTGLKMLPKPKPVNIWYGPQGGCYNYPTNANGIGIYTNSINTASPGIWRSCPFINSTGSQAPMDGGIYRKPAGDKPDAWPAYWDGRWFLGDFASATALRHALLMDPATQFNGGQPVSADSLASIIPTATIGNTRLITMNFGPDGALYVGSYANGYYTWNNNTMGIWRFAYTGGPDTPGPDPQATVSGAKAQFSIGRSGGVSYKWDFGDGATSTDPGASHTYTSAGNKDAKLTVTYADGDTAAKTFQVAIPDTAFATATTDVGTTVPTVLSLTIGAKPSFGALTPSVAKDYNASTTAMVLATSGDAKLSVSDPSTTATGHLVNGTYSLPSALQVKASSTTTGVGGAFANVRGSGDPTTLLAYAGPTPSDTVVLDFLQHVSVTDALRAGSYSKTLTFTLSTSTP